MKYLFGSKGVYIVTIEEKYWLNHKEINNIIYRKCSTCNEWFPETYEYFYMKNKSKPEKGFTGECKECASKRSYAIQKRNPEIKIKAEKKYNAKKECKEKRKIWSQNARDNGYYNKYFINNPEKQKEYQLKRRQNKKHNITKEEWMRCKEYFNNSCAYCGLHISKHYKNYKGKPKLYDLHKEHVDDKGSNGLENCVPSCNDCNSSKRANNLFEWYNQNNENYSKNRFDKIIKWMSEDYKKYI